MQQNFTGHMNSLDAQLSEALKIAPYPRVKRIFRSETNDIVQSFRDELNSFKSTLESDLGRYKISLDDQATRLDKASSDAERIGNSMLTMQGQLDAKVAAWDDVFKAFTSERQSEFNNELTSLRNEQSEEIRRQEKVTLQSRDEAVQALENIKKDHIALIGQMRTNLDDAIAEINESGHTKLSEINDIYSAVGNTALAGDILTNANDERAIYASNSRWAKLFYILAPTTLILMLYLSNSLPAPSVEEVLKKLPVTIVLLIPAAYFSNLASKHRRIEVALRSLGLRIKAFDPYLAHFPPEERNSIKREMANVFFDARISVDGDRQLNTKAITNELDRVGNLVEKIVDIAKSIVPTKIG